MKYQNVSRYSVSTQSQDQGCFMFKTLGIFFQWILKIWIHSTLLQCSTAVDIIYQQNISIYFCVSAGCVDIYGADRTCSVYLTSGRWRRTGRKGPNVTNLQQICNINIAPAAPCCTLLHLRPSLAAKCQSGNSSQKKFLDSLETFYPILNI